jgi:hypothetical protein
MLLILSKEDSSEPSCVLVLVHALWRSFVISPGPIITLPAREQQRSYAPGSNVFSSHAPPLSSVVEPAPLPVRPWREMKSRRGAPKRVNTEGFACPNRGCPSFGITDAHIHASCWGWHACPCRAHPDLSRSCLPHHVQCSMPHSLVSFENRLSPNRDGADLARACGLDPSEALRVAGLSTRDHHEPF